MREIRPLLYGALAFVGSFTAVEVQEDPSKEMPRHSNPPYVIVVEAAQPSHVKFVNPSSGDDERLKELREKGKEAANQLIEKIAEQVLESLHEREPPNPRDAVRMATPQASATVPRPAPEKTP